MLQSVVSTLLGVLVPLAVPVAAGALLARFRTWDTKPLLTLYLYVLSPAIIFDTLRNAHISTDELYSTIGFALVNLLLRVHFRPRPRHIQLLGLLSAHSFAANACHGAYLARIGQV